MAKESAWHLVDVSFPAALDDAPSAAAEGSPVGAQDINAGQKIVVRIEDRELLIFRIRDDYFAIGSRCTHAAWPLAGEPIEGFEIICTLHGARFDVRDGCPTRGPASKPLAHFPVELRDGAIYVSLPS